MTMKPANDYGSSTNQPAWVAIAVAVIMSVVGPLLVWNATNRNVELQKNDTSTLSQEVNRLVDRVNQIRSTVEAYSTSPSLTGTPQAGIELADLKKLNEQISTLEQQVAGLNARPSPTPLPGPLVSAGDLEALRNRVVDLEKTIQAYGTPEPLTLPTVLAQEGIPVDSRLAIEGATASSTLNQLDSNEKPIYTPTKLLTPTMRQCGMRTGPIGISHGLSSSWIVHTSLRELSSWLVTGEPLSSRTPC